MGVTYAAASVGTCAYHGVRDAPDAQLGVRRRCENAITVSKDGHGRDLKEGGGVKTREGAEIETVV